MRRRTARLAFFTVLILGSLMTSAALAADWTADAILDEIEGKTSLTGSGAATIELITVNQRGQERANQLKVYRKDDADGVKQLLEYLTPADVAGTKFLSVEEDGVTNMWLYLPVLGRERRIAGSATQDTFMGTDFTFEEIGDMGHFSVDYSAERLDDDVYDGMDTYVLRLTPSDADSAYSFVTMWVWKEHFLPVNIEFYDLEGQRDKTLVSEDLRPGDDGEWQPYRITMADVKKGTQTIVRIIDTEEEDIPDDYFTLRYLRR